MASNGVKSEKLNFQLPVVAHERLCVSSLLAVNYSRCQVPILPCYSASPTSNKMYDDHDLVFVRAKSLILSQNSITVKPSLGILPILF